MANSGWGHVGLDRPGRGSRPSDLNVFQFRFLPAAGGQSIGGFRVKELTTKRNFDVATNCSTKTGN